MRVSFNKDTISGTVEIPAGEYWVNLASEFSQIVLVGGGREYRVSATKRRAQIRGRTSSASLVAGGSAIWSLVVCIPKQGEWISNFEVNKHED